MRSSGSNPRSVARVRAGGIGEVCWCPTDPCPAPFPISSATPLPEALLFELGGAGLGIGSINRVDSDDFLEGTVLSTDPAAGPELPRNQPISVTVVALLRPERSFPISSGSHNPPPRH